MCVYHWDRVPPITDVGAGGVARYRLLEDAARIAFEQRDREALAHVEALCGPNNRAVLQLIGQYRQTLRP